MKNYTTLLGVCLVLLSLPNFGYAQEFQGKASYKSHQNVEVTLDSTMSSEEQAMIQKMMQDQMNNDFELTFDKNQSYFKKLEKLAAPSQASGVQVMVMTTGGEELYKNIAEQRYSSEQDLFGKVFLVKDSLETFDWKLGSETKKIGEYTCYKATYTRMSQGSFTIDGVGNKTEGKPTEIVTTVWYAPKIPVSNGPEQYWGLPGLIMEVNERNRVLICVKVVLNSAEPIVISEPTKGKVVSSEEFDELMEEKMLEMQKMNQGGKQKGNGRVMEISIER